MWRMGAYFLIHRYWFAVGQVSLQRVFSAEAGSYVCETLSLINAVFCSFIFCIDGAVSFLYSVKSLLRIVAFLVDSNDIIDIILATVSL